MNICFIQLVSFLLDISCSSFSFWTFKAFLKKFLPLHCKRDQFSQDGERQRLHDALEAETIKASVLRHKLLNVPLETEKEIQSNSLFVFVNSNFTDQHIIYNNEKRFSFESWIIHKVVLIMVLSFITKVITIMLITINIHRSCKWCQRSKSKRNKWSSAVVKGNQGHDCSFEKSTKRNSWSRFCLKVSYASIFSMYFLINWSIFN